MDFSNRLKNLREDNDYSQEKLAEALGITKNAISHYECGICLPKLETLIFIADVFNVSLDYLIARTDFNLPNLTLKSAFSKNYEIGQIIEKIINLDATHKTDLLKALEYIEKDNRRSKQMKD